MKIRITKTSYFGIGFLVAKSFSWVQFGWWYVGLFQKGRTNPDEAIGP